MVFLAERRAVNKQALALRALGDHPDVFIVGNASNLWLDGEPTAEALENFALQHTMDIWVPIAKQVEVKHILEAVLGEPLNARVVVDWKDEKCVQWSTKPFLFNQLLVRVVSTGTSVASSLITLQADITANMKYVNRNQLVGLLPTAIEDAKEKRLVWLKTCSSARKQYILSLARQQSEPSDWYCGAAEPPPPPVEKFTGVLTGWRCYTLASAIPLLMGDMGRYWRDTKFRAECRGKYEGPDSPDDPHHMKQHAEESNGGACGIYMQFTPRVNHKPWQVYAQCVAWGNVHLYTHGCRAQYVKITRLYVVDERLIESDPEIGQWLERVYQVPVSLRVPQVPMDKIWDGGQPVLPTLEEFLGVEELFEDRRITY